MTTEPQAISIRPIDTIEEMREIEELQRRIWGVTDLDVFPALAFRPLKEVGSILLGAFVGNEMIGFVFGFPGRLKGESIVHSDMLGVLPEYQSKRVGYQLKLAQREAALAAGVNKITWTFDPLRSRNAHLNVNKLGVTSDRYEIDFYGKTSSTLHHGGTDRLWVTWDLDSPRVQDRLSGQHRSFDDSDICRFLVCDESGLPLKLENKFEQEVAIEIPDERIYSNQPDLHTSWREATRDSFTKLINAGFVVEEFVLLSRDQKRVGAYILKR